MFKTGNLFTLAEKQLIREVNIGLRNKYTKVDVIDYAIRIRKFLDRRGGNIEGIMNRIIHTKKELRRQKYLRYEQKKRKQ